MPNRSVLGGSPLGIIGVKSAASIQNTSTFPARNINVASYNQSRAGSLFSGRRRFRAWPSLANLPEIEEKDDKGQPIAGGKKYTDFTGVSLKRSDAEKEYKQAQLHSDEIYDTSIQNIILKLANTKASLKPQDFAFCKNVGVYPNNRLMIARRFGSPQPDNIMIKEKSGYVGTFATLITWIPEGEDFLNITFGEEWEPAEADFRGVLNSLGEDIGLGNLGGIGGAAGNLVPLPGFTEIFQRQFLRSLGLLENQATNQIPAGNPNLIKEAKRRKTIGYSEAGSGLSCQVSIKFKCEYELKYISGIDPTIVWLDIVSNIVRFGTSESSNYGLNGGLAAKLLKWAADPVSLIKEVISKLKNAITDIAREVRKFINDAYNAATAAASDAAKEETGTENIYQGAQEAKSLSEKLLAKITSLISTVSNALIAKYRVRILGIVNALSGQPSTPWHVTIGNPLRPVFCSGDMLCKTTTLKLGPQLAFNDLPSSIEAEFTLENARPWGLQEIMAKFNSGYIRVVDTPRSFFEAEAKEFTTDGKKADFVFEPTGAFPEETTFVNNEEGVKSSGTSGTSGNSGTSASRPSTSGTSGTAAGGGGGGTNLTNSQTGDSGNQVSSSSGSSQPADIGKSSNYASGSAGTSGEVQKLENKETAESDPNKKAFSNTDKPTEQVGPEKK